MHIHYKNIKLETIINKSKTSNVKKKSRAQTKHYEANSQDIPSAVGHLLLAMGPFLKCDLYTLLYSIGAKQFSFVFASWRQHLSWGQRIASTFPVHSRSPSILDLCIPCPCCHSLCEFICASVLLCLEDTSSLMSFFMWFPEPQGKWLDESTLCRAKHSTVCHSLHMDQLWLSTFVPTGRSIYDVSWDTGL